jgi:hypothetical protein
MNYYNIKIFCIIVLIKFIIDIGVELKYHQNYAFMC